MYGPPIKKVDKSSDTDYEWTNHLYTFPIGKVIRGKKSFNISTVSEFTKFLLHIVYTK